MHSLVLLPVALEAFLQSGIKNAESCALEASCLHGVLVYLRAEEAAWNGELDARRALQRGGLGAAFSQTDLSRNLLVRCHYSI